nr:transposase, MuDR [Tanacetum cinerariifolium]
PSLLTQTGMVDFVSGRAVIETAQRKRVKYEAIEIAFSQESILKLSISFFMVMVAPVFGQNRAKSTPILHLGVVYEDLGFKDGKILFSHFRMYGKSLNEGLTPLMSNEDVLSLLWHVYKDREIEVYVENDVSLVKKKMMKVSLNKGKGILIEEIIKDDDVDDVENENKASTSKDLKEKVKQGMQGDLHTLNNDDDLLQLDDPIVWQHDNYHGHNEEEETALLFAKLDQLLEHVYFLNVKLRESVVGVAPLLVAIDAQVVPVDAPVVPLDGPVIAFEKEIQRPRKRKRDMEDESASVIVTFGRANKRRRLNPTDKTEKLMKDKLMEAIGLGFHL